jgi:hypothetical protein
MKDSLGRTIKPGDVIVYPGRSGSYVWINHGVVMEVEETYIKVCPIKESHVAVRLSAQAYKLYRTDRCTILGISAAELLELVGVN